MDTPLFQFNSSANLLSWNLLFNVLTYYIILVHTTTMWVFNALDLLAI